jgi:hypothetical protein
MVTLLLMLVGEENKDCRREIFQGMILNAQEYYQRGTAPVSWAAYSSI